MAETVRLMLGDCIERMGEIDDSSVDAVITDPPYPEIDRPYGRMTEAGWDGMMRRLIPECRRVLKPTGSAVFILQPNSEKVGRMRPWLWEFMAWTCREWNQVQDAWWWNTCALPVGGAITAGLLRSSIKAAVWLGSPDCYRNQESVLMDEASHNEVIRKADRNRSDTVVTGPSGCSVDVTKARYAVFRRGGVTPFNCLALGRQNRKGTHGHSASTPMNVADWWVRYISPPGGVVLDPFVGSGTVALAALAQGRSAIGIERDAGYFQIATDRIAAAQAATPLLSAAQ